MSRKGCEQGDNCAFAHINEKSVQSEPLEKAMVQQEEMVTAEKDSSTQGLLLNRSSRPCPFNNFRAWVKNQVFDPSTEKAPWALMDESDDEGTSEATHLTAQCKVETLRDDVSGCSVEQVFAPASKDNPWATLDG